MKLVIICIYIYIGIEREKERIIIVLNNDYHLAHNSFTFSVKQVIVLYLLQYTVFT